MAHRSKISRVPYVKVDGSVSDKKFRYALSCKCRGKVCLKPQVFDRISDAEIAENRHHQDVKARAGKKNQPTPKRPSTMHPARRAKRASDRIEMARQNAVLAELREN